jgi:DNA-binding NarL/FixJ family response regulator
MKIKLAIVEDHQDISENLKSMLSQHGEIEEIRVYHSAEAIISDTSGSKYDVVLMDIGLPGINGIECIRKLKPSNLETQFVVFTIFEDHQHVFDALCAGATGYILKNSSTQDILTAVIDVHKGASPMSASISRMVIQYFSGVPKKLNTLPISEREKQVLDLLAQGFRYKEISESLFISMDTVRTHIRNIYQKLEVTNRTQAINRLRG